MQITGRRKETALHCAVRGRQDIAAYILVYLEPRP